MAGRYSNNLGKRIQRRRLGSSKVRTNNIVKLRGGLNLVESAASVSPGELIVSKNYEPFFINGAYKRVEGFERFDGRSAPHLAEYWRVDLNTIAGGPFTEETASVRGETVTASTGETARVAAYHPDEVSDNEGYMILTDLSAHANAGVTWTGGTSSATAVGASDTKYEGEEATEALHDAAQLAAEAVRRNVITAVGAASATGDVNGVHVYNDTVYAFRNNAADTAGTMWKSSSSGWTQVALGFRVFYNTGSVQINEGDVLTDATSGATCTVQRVITKTGYWSGGDAAGYVITSLITGTFGTGNTLTVGGTAVAVTDSSTASSAITIPKDGTYRFRNYNFGGHTGTYRMYGVNGVGNGFEFDGSVFVPIETGMTTDKPTHIGVHRGSLLLAFSGGSLQISGYLQPLSWQAFTGANEILPGDEITGFIEEINNVTFVFTRNQTFKLSGFVRENMQLTLHNFETGALSGTMQRIGRSIYLDDRGFTSLAATDVFGDFASSQIALKVDPLIQSYLKDSTVNTSIINRGKSVYRCFFSSQEAIVVGFSGNRVNGVTTVNYGKDVLCAANGEIEDSGTNNGQERTFFGSSDGFVYEMDTGRNFDGSKIEAYFVTHYYFAGNPESNKRWRDLVLYIENTSRTTVQVSADYNYNENQNNFENVLDEFLALGGGRWDIARHGNFTYSSSSKSDIRVPMNSSARNVSLIVYHNEDNEEAHTMYEVNFHASQRRQIRG